MAPSISCAENSFGSLETTIYLFFKYYPEAKGWKEYIFKKWSYV